MPKIVSERRFGKTHKQHKHTDNAGLGMGFEKYCFECGELLEEDGEWNVYTCSECCQPLRWVSVIKYKHCPECGVKFERITKE